MRSTNVVVLSAVLAAFNAFADDAGNHSMEHMNGMDHGMPAESKQQSHRATGVVKSVDNASSTVTLAHGPVSSLKWPAMTMGFKVKDAALLKKLAVGQKVDVEFVQQASDYVVIAVH